MRPRLALLTAAMLALAACRSAEATPATQVFVPPTSAPTATARFTATPRPTSTKPPPTAAPATVAPSTATQDGTGGGGGSSVFLIDFSVQPARVHRVDSFSGAEQNDFAAPGLTINSVYRASDNFLFYYDSDAAMLRRLDGTGNSTDLPFVKSGTAAFDVRFLPSPDGSQIAWGTSDLNATDANATDVTLNVANVDGSGLQTVYHATLQNQSVIPQPVQWSADGGRFYFTNEPYGIGGYILFSGGPDLLAVDVATGKVGGVLNNKGCLCAMAVSPDGATVAVITGAGPLTLVLHDTAGGADRTAPVDAGHLQAGDILWAPDGHSLVYTMAVSNFDNPDQEKFAIVQVDAGTLKQTVLVPDDPQLPFSALWPDSNMIWVGDKALKVSLLNPEGGALKALLTGRAIAINR